MSAILRRNPGSVPICVSIFLLILAGSAQVLSQHHRLANLKPSLPGSGSSAPRAILLATPQRTTPDGVASSSSPSPKPSLSAAAQLRQSHILFERNDGQVDREVLYLSYGSGYSLFLTRTGATIVLAERRNKAATVATSRSRYFRLHFADANPYAQVIGIEALPGTSNYFSGSDPKLWHTRIPQFAEVRYSNLYPGIDLIFYFRDGQLEYDVIASPGADLNAVNLQVEGAKPSLTREGDVAIKMGANELVRLRKPYAYQSAGAATAVAASYSLHDAKLSFALGRYDPTQTLVIDPALAFATFISSNCAICIDTVSDIAADNTGVYLTGSTNAAIFPATASGPASSNPQAIQQTFVTKLDPTGSHVLYSVFLSDSSGQSIAVDGVGSAYVSGVADYPSSGSAAFPLTTGVFSAKVPSNATGPAAYATKLSPDGSSILYSTLLQQPMPSGNPVNNFQFVTPSKIAVDSNGALYVTGVASPNSINRFISIWMPLPVTVGAFQTTPGADFVLKLDPNATGLDYATYIDGTNAANPYVAGIAVDSSGDAFVAGSAPGPGFPTTAGAYQTSTSGGGAFVMALNPNGTGQVYSTFFGTNALAFGLAVDSHSQAVLTGYSGGTLPVTPNAFCGNITSGAYTGFVTKFKADGSGLIYATSLCDGDSQAASVAVDSTGAAYVVGLTAVSADFQPSLLRPIQGYPPSAGNSNIAVKLDTSGALQWATFFGTSSGLIGQGIPSASKVAVDSNGATYFLCTSTILPTANSVGPPSLAPGAGGGSSEALNFLLKIAPSLGAPVPIVSPRQLSFTNQNVGTSSTPADVQVGNFGDAPTSPMVTITGDFLETDNCSVAVPGGQKCDISVVFKPSVTGPRTGTLTVGFGGNIPSQTVSLSGNAGAPAVTLSPTSLSFPVQATGTTSGAQQDTITNSGTGPLTITSLQTSGPFATTNTCGAPVAPSSDCTVQVTFTPTASGTQTGTLTITDNAPNSPQTVALTGNVAQGPPPSIGLGIPSGGSASAMVTAGATATYALAIGGAGMGGIASLTCTGAPTGAACSVSATVPISASTASTFNATVTTTARSHVWFYPGGPTPWLWALAILGCLVLIQAASGARFPRLCWRLAPLLGLALCACGGGSSMTPSPTPNPNATPAGAYTIVVTAKSGSTTQTQNLTLRVQ